jgi:hypothetical protein
MTFNRHKRSDDRTPIPVEYLVTSDTSHDTNENSSTLHSTSCSGIDDEFAAWTCKDLPRPHQHRRRRRRQCAARKQGQPTWISSVAMMNTRMNTGV